MVYLKILTALILIIGIFWIIGWHAKQHLFKRVLSNFPDILIGFIAYLALFQLIAFPFLIFHGNPRVFMIIVATLTLAWVVVALCFLLKRGFEFKIRKPSWQSILLFSVTIFVIILGIVFQRYDIDDSFYLGMAADNLVSDSIYAHDPATGIDGYPMSGVYSLGSYELYIAFIAKITSLSVATIAHIVLAIIVTALSIASYYSLLRTLFNDKHKASVATSILVIVMLFSSFSVYLSSNFILARSWQGKALLIGIFMPVFLALCLSFFKSLSGNQRQKQTSYFVALLLTQLGAFAVSPVSIYLIPPLLLIALLTTIPMMSSRQDVGRYFSSSILILSPTLMAAVALYFVTRDSTSLEAVKSITLNFDQWVLILKSFYGKWEFAVLTILSIVILLVQNKYTQIRYFALATLTCMLLIANPIVAPQIAQYFTSAVTYWRLFWLIFPELLIALGIYVLAEQIWSFRRKSPVFAILIIVMSSIVFLRFNNGYIFSKDNGFGIIKNIHKSPPSAVVAASLSAEPLIFADQLTAAYVRSINPRINVAYSRENYMANVVSDHNEYLVLTNIFRALDGNVKPYNQLPSDLIMRDIDYIVYPSSNKDLAYFLKLNQNTSVFYEGDNFIVEKIDP